MSKLIKTRRVLQSANDEGKRFASDEASLLLDSQSWHDMGEPESITITVESGDQLNQPDN